MYERLAEGEGCSFNGFAEASQDVCPWNVRFARALPADSPFTARGELAEKIARTLARDLLAMSQEEFSVAFRNSPMKRAKLRGSKRNAAVVLGNVGTPEDIEILTRALHDPEPLVREHVASSLRRLGSTSEANALESASGSSQTVR